MGYWSQQWASTSFFWVIVVSILVCFPGTVCIFLFLQLFLSSLPFSIPSVSGGGDAEAACSAPWLEGVVSGTRWCILRVQMLDLLTGSPPTTITSHPHTTFSADSATPGPYSVPVPRCLLLLWHLPNQPPRPHKSCFLHPCVVNTSDAPEPKHHMCLLGVSPLPWLWLSAVVLVLSSQHSPGACWVACRNVQPSFLHWPLPCSMHPCHRQVHGQRGLEPRSCWGCWWGATAWDSVKWNGKFWDLLCDVPTSQSPLSPQPPHLFSLSSPP